MATFIYMVGLPSVIGLVIWQNYMTRKFVRRYQQLTGSKRFSYVFIDVSAQSDLIAYLWRRRYRDSDSIELIVLCESYRQKALLATVSMFVIVTLIAVGFIFF